MPQASHTAGSLSPQQRNCRRDLESHDCCCQLFQHAEESADVEQLPISHLVAGLALALTFGGMTFFSAVVAPLVFTRLPLDIAGTFIRQIFPWYYLTMGTTILIALTALISGAGGSVTWEAALATLVLAGFAFARQVLMPKINHTRDAEMAGETGAARRFRHLHRMSVAINGIQWLAVLAALTGVLV